MKAYGRMDVHIQVLSTSALAGGKWPASRPHRFTLGEETPCTHLIEGWVSLTVGLDGMKK
jgi:hypothetical protein